MQSSNASESSVVHAAAVNDWDLALLTGKPYLYRLFTGLLRPKTAILGAEIAGTVEATEDIGLPADTPAPGFSGVTLAHNVASEQEVDAVLQQAVAAGANLIKPGQTVFWGGYSGYFQDPDGHYWEVAYNPFENLT